MKTWQKIGIGVGVAAVLGGISWYSVVKQNEGVITVQTGQVVRQDLTSVVTASGEIRPKNYTNVLGEGLGKITDIDVKEGDDVKKGAVLLHLENIQPGADVQAQQASIDAAVAAVQAASANYDAAVATVAQRQSDLDKSKLDWQRGQLLYKEQLIAKQEYDTDKATYDSAAAALTSAQDQVDQMRAAREQARSNLAMNRAQLRHTADVLAKTTYTAPISGIISYIAVRVGENVVPGIQGTAGSSILTISDMSVVTAEVMVDETDIVSVKNGQPADVTIDAIPDKTFKGHVTEVGELAILRTSGAASMTEVTANTQEARDFKVVVTLDNPPASLRPGLSATAKIQTASKTNVLTIPIQALAERSQRELDEAKNGTSSSANVTLAAANDAASKDIQGVFVIRAGKAQFIPVQTGITGVANIEVTGGLQEGDTIVTGSFKALRSLKPGTSVKIDNSAPSLDETSATSSS
ncbi:MAG TPA: efflux RND transporter periplasmic adaptor subunit [Candidatus Acidoferrales bacterium]|jgi:HlyD family secretion protein|nr:efflux RND transporter periplasmic adaptor subunit [Candidatus Acidoferrales bacterium]